MRPMRRRAVLSAAGAGWLATACGGGAARPRAPRPAAAPASVELAPAPAPVAAPGAGPALRSAELLADAALLRRTYEALHPGLYRYTTPARLAARYAELERALGRDQTLQEAYVAIAAFTASVKCGHSYPNFFNQPKEVAAALFAGLPRLPFFFRWLGGRMVVTRSFAGDARLAPGAEVLAIDGVPAPTLLARLLPLARADGSNDAKRVSVLEARGESKYEAFDVYYPMLFPPRGGAVELLVADARTGARATLRAATVGQAEREAAVEAREKARRGGDDVAPWELRFLDDGLALLTMPTWALYRTAWDWRGFLDEAFATLARRGARDLVIDLRGNEGGLSVGDVLLSHLSAREVRLDQFRRYVRYRAVPADLAPHLDTWDRSFLDWGDAAVDAGGGFYRLTRYDDDERGSVVRPARPTFAGRAWVLVDASNSSATFEFALAVRDHRLGTLVGQPLGGNRRGINGGAFFFLRLPGSKIEVDVPLIGFYPDGERPDAGLAPDVAVAPAAADVAAGADVELAAVRAQIRR
ncbi:MAG TPA: S41 family peptidase [Polyangiaceae bacterium]|nr:S41 family peptidase [Polyangiaceae bacterium]